MVFRALTCVHTSVCICSSPLPACLSFWLAAHRYKYFGNRIDLSGLIQGQIPWKKIVVHIWGLTPHLATKCSLSLRAVFLCPSWGNNRSLALRPEDASVSLGQAVQASTERTTFLSQTHQEQFEDSRCAFVLYFIWSIAVSLCFPFTDFQNAKENSNI